MRARPDIAMREKLTILIAFLFLQSGSSPAFALDDHGTPGQLVTEQASMPYQFSYFAGGHDGSHSRHEARDANGRVYGHYTLATAEGSQRVVCYVADENGFRAWVDTNEQGTANDDPADVSIRSTAPGTQGTPRGPIQGICGRPPAQSVVAHPPVVVPPRKTAYVPVQEVILPPVVKHIVEPPPVRKTSYVPVQHVTVHDTYVPSPPVHHVPYVRKVVVKRPPPVRDSYLVPQPPKTVYVPVEQQVFVQPPPVVHRTKTIVRRPGYLPARDDPPTEVSETYHDTPPHRPWTPAPKPWTPAPKVWTPAPKPWTPAPKPWTPAPKPWTPAPQVWTPAPQVWTPPPKPWTPEPRPWTPEPRPWTPPRRPWTSSKSSYAPQREVYRPPVQDVYVPRGYKSSCSGYCGPKVTARVVPSEEVYVKTSTGPASYSVRRGYISPRYEPSPEPSYTAYQAWKPSYDIPIGMSYKMTISKSPGPYPWDYQRRPSQQQSYYRPAQTSSYPSTPSSYSSPSRSYSAPKSRGSYSNDLDLDQMYEFKQPTYG
ncbi:extensin isoform X1 [Ixodes scapularis]|uniref:extensin isoform X1 n=2 Tax=Ixodes scapularis TaxID=6945 RepID=UPI001A9DC2B8|nr:extensin isoform X1 [Ixodes scapularis]